MQLNELVKLLTEHKGVLVANDQLYQEAKRIFEKTNRLALFDPTNPKKTAGILEGLIKNGYVTEEVLQEESEEFETRALTKADLEPILAAYDEYRGKKEEDVVKAAIRRDPKLQRVKVADILGIIRYKAEKEAKLIREGKTLKEADRVSDRIVEVTKSLEEAIPKRTSQGEIEKIATRIVEEVSKTIESPSGKGGMGSKTGERVATAQEPTKIERLPEKEDLVLEKTATKIPGVPDETLERVEKESESLIGNESDTLRKVQEGVRTMVKEEKIEPMFAEAVVEVAEELAAKEIVSEQIEVATSYISQKIEEITEPATEEQRTEIEKVVRERVEYKVLEEATVELNYHTVEIVEEKKEVERVDTANKDARATITSEGTTGARAELVVGERKTDETAVGADQPKTKTIKTGRSLVEEITRIIGRPLVEEETIGVRQAIKEGEDLTVKIISQGRGEGEKPTLVTNKDNLVDIVKANKLESEVFRELTEKGENRESAREYAKLIRKLSFPSEEVAASVAEIQAYKVMEDNGFKAGDNIESVKTAKIVNYLIRSPAKIGGIVEKISLVSGKLEGVKGAQPLLKVVSFLKNNEKLTKSLEFIQGVIRFTDKISNFTSIISNPIGYVFRIPAVQQFAVKIATKFGGQMVGAMATQIAQFGLKQGLTNIAGQLFAKGTVAVVQAGVQGAAAAGAAAGTTAVTAGAAAASATVPVVGWVVAAVLMGVEVIKFVGKVVNNVLKSVNLDMDGLENWLKSSFGKVPGGLLSFGLKAGGLIAVLLLAIPTMLAVATIPLWPIVGVIGGTIFYNHFQTASTQVSSLVVPKGVGGMVCVKKDDLIAPAGGSLANCNVNAPTTNAINVTKSTFVNVAERWRAGGAKNAERCFNDVVCRAKTAGINPDFALWAWLHESGASNYDGFPNLNVEDFGIRGQASAPPENFDAQIKYFLNLDPASACLGKPKIGNDYWLAFATNYLNGSDNDCDPDVINPIANVTPRQYLSEMEATWSWINTGPMPGSIHIAPEACGGGNSTTTDRTDTAGNVLVCEIDPDVAPGPPAAPLPTRDPSIPIPEECPGGWPLRVKACITQGSFGSYSHAVIEALDFGGWCYGGSIGGASIFATHSGVATAGGGEASAYGYFVDITSTCKGKQFTTRYAHMPSIPANIQNKVVKRGDVIGRVNNSGTYRAPGNEHLHYEILWRALKMNDYIPQPVPNGCYGWEACGSVIINP